MYAESCNAPLNRKCHIGRRITIAFLLWSQKKRWDDVTVVLDRAWRQGDGWTWSYPDHILQFCGIADRARDQSFTTHVHRKVHPALEVLSSKDAQCHNRARIVAIMHHESGCDVSAEKRVKWKLSRTIMKRSHRSMMQATASWVHHWNTSENVPERSMIDRSNMTGICPMVVS